jgi:hypothetical protein
MAARDADLPCSNVLSINPSSTIEVFMLRPQKDLFTRFSEVTEAWRKMRPNKQFFGYTLEGFLEAAKPFIDAREEIAGLEKQVAHAVSKRDAASGPLLEALQGVVDAVKGDRAEGPNGELYGAMGYIRKSERSTGLVRPRKGAPTSEGGGS